MLYRLVLSQSVAECHNAIQHCTAKLISTQNGMCQHVAIWYTGITKSFLVFIVL